VHDPLNSTDRREPSCQPERRTNTRRSEVDAAMETHQIRYFVAVCAERNFTRAAKRCNVSQPSLTRAIKLLEKELGGQLFVRGRERSSLSELGHLVKPLLERAYRCTEDAKCLALYFMQPGTARVPARARQREQRRAKDQGEGAIASS